ncbi:uncharacterized protein RSE6_03574 [Rhynchosporium secalis]|uniref:Heterokaryon incompatibility domain-containing protein n=1 Tax=Rhynchosporium secalis TaxID=38038 RepID=A0A1E1M328_RHYSE|nr:uncharacterized protein RSE6_03574 [Rhynchosporium secalis]
MSAVYSGSYCNIAAHVKDGLSGIVFTTFTPLQSIYHECMATSQTCEAYPEQIPKSQQQLKGVILDVDLKAGVGTDAVSIKTWTAILENYSGTQLGYESDRLIAISGLAERMRAASDQTLRYAAGFWLFGPWRPYLPIVLEKSSSRKGSGHVSGTILVLGISSRENSVGLKIPDWKNTAFSSIKDTSYYPCNVLNWSVETEGSNPMGKALSGLLCLEGPLFPIKHSMKSRSIHCLLGSVHVLLDFFLDATGDKFKLIGNFCLAVLSIIRSVLTRGYALLLRPTGEIPRSL